MTIFRVLFPEVSGKISKAGTVSAIASSANLASQKIDQRIIDEFVGHTTEQMRRRYRHLFPDVKRDAIEKVFG